MELAGDDLARELLQRAAWTVRAVTLAAALAIATGVVALGQFDRAWGVVPLGDGAAPTRVVVVDSVTSADAP